MKHSKKLLSLLLTASMAISLIPATVMADTAKAPLTRIAAVSSMAQQSKDVTRYTTIEEAAAAARANMAARVEEFTVEYQFPEEAGTASMSKDELGKYCGVVYDEIKELACAHTGVPYEGDYIEWHIKSSGVSMEYTSTNAAFNFHMEYYTTAEQEAEVASTIDSVLKSLDLEGKSDYEKFIAIYNYITKNTKYDNANLKDTGYTLKYSAYAALINHTAVCQGYANLLYRMLLQAGIDNRMITGIGNGGPHAWNIVKLGDKYYNVDSTWDSKDAGVNFRGEVIEYHYFMNYRLKSEADFPNHTRDDKFTTEEFNTAYPMSTESYALPTFLGHSVALSDEIAVKFLVDIPDNVDTSSVYVVFTLSDGRSDRVDLADAEKTTYTESSYFFTCRINSLEVADTITATLHYGSVGDTVENTYSAQQYCQDIQARGGYSQYVVDLVKSIQNYGYYLQKSGWTDNLTHTEAVPASELTADDIERVKPLVEKYAFVSPVGQYNIIASAYSVGMSSKTNLYLYVQLAEKHSYPDNSAFKPVNINGELRWYVYTLNNIDARYLGTTYQINGAKISVLSYVNAFLNGNASSYATEKKYALIALYDYYAAVDAYVKIPANA